ncbi:MAG: alanine--tRNA ligase [Rhodospirillaceae bacterium TMED63]|nr:alanine--tRNA ligase [Rhodospirillaceae bacterium]RPG00112.1 MAG: alanine--tRNA ligase [Rhodospirillaceae bacterium TMED63]
MTASTNDIRATFLDYFAKNGHEIVASSPLVPHNDPTLLFTNAGMVQFKNVFTGLETRTYNRATTSQKCVRAGGKHNDLENVGYTARHHTFFEMLGNFSFGDYFKDVAIEYAWNLVTKEYGLPAEKLLVTVFSQDDQAFDLWQKIAGLSDDRIIRIPTSDNFWSMGDTGPCGPCSEIFFDHGDKISGGPPGSPDEEGDRFIEIWNLVFMQFEQTDADTREELPKPSIDTGMGLERIAAVLQGKHNNYEIDLMHRLIEASAEASGVAPDGDHVSSHRVIADHLRASSFLIADGVLPSNEGRGYVLRRIMRRAMRHAHIMGCEEPLLWKLVPSLVGEMGKAFPELERAEALVGETLKLEETRFRETLGRGLRLLEDETDKLGKGEALDGEVAFKLYDTYGFPLDLTEDVLRGQGRSVDNAGFDAAMERQRAEARKNWAGSGSAADESVWFDIRERVGASEFLGYTTETADGAIVALVVDGAEVGDAEEGAEVEMVANQTPFYGESGGQKGDAGGLTTDGAEIVITDTQKKLGDLHIHRGTVSRGTVKVGDAGVFLVENGRRSSLRAHHSATHLLHEALRRRLGDHVTQKGSLVAPDRLRFDISHPSAIEADELREIEREVNARIRLNTPVDTRLMTPDEAIEQGAMALFGEKYGDEVRVVTMGGDTNRFSVELCGGTHVSRTGDIGFFHIIGESAVASGVRRIEALAGATAEAYSLERENLLGQVALDLKTGPEDVPSRVLGLLEERKKLEREISNLRRKLATGGGSPSDNGNLTEISGLKYAPRVMEGIPGKELKSMADEIKKQIGSGVTAIVSVDDGKASIVVGVTDDVTERISAVDLVRVGSAALGGKGGGGRPDMAQAGGPDGSAARAAVEAIAEALSNL